MIMQKDKRERLESRGWKVGTVDEFLDLTPEESRYIEMKLALAHSLRDKRVKKGLSQIALAELISSSQSRVAKMESADTSVSLDLLIRSLLALGVTNRQVAAVLANA